MVLKSSKTLAAIALTLVGIAGSGCGMYHGEMEGNNFKFAIQPQTIESGGILGGVLSSLGIDFPFEAAVPAATATSKEIKEIYLDTIAIRTTLAADMNADGTGNEERLMDDNLIDTCVTNQAKIDFLKSLEIIIQKEGSAEKVVLAKFTNTMAGTCGFYMEIQEDPSTGKAWNLKSFLPHYTITTKATGSAPPSTVKLGGYISVDWVAPDIELPPEQPPQQNQ